MIVKLALGWNVRKKRRVDDIRWVCEKSKRETPRNILIYKEYFLGFHSLSQQVSH